MIFTRTLSMSLIGAAAFFVGGCVTHNPISEATIFHDPATRPMHTGSRAFGAAITATPVSRMAVDLLRVRRPESQRREIFQPLNTARLGAGVFLASFDRAGRYGYSITAGLPMLGADATFKLWRRNYVSASISVPGQGQIFFQHRTYNSVKQGVSIGVGYRRDAYAYLDLREWLDTTVERVDSFGIRGFAVLRGDGSVVKGGRLDVYIGYVPALDRTTFSVSVTAGGF